MLRDGKIERMGHPHEFKDDEAQEDDVKTKAGTEPTATKEEKGGQNKEEQEDDDGEEDTQTALSRKVYTRYLRSMGGPLFWILYSLVNIGAHVLMLAQGWWIGQWTSRRHPDANHDFRYYFGIYSLIQLSGGICT